MKELETEVQRRKAIAWAIGMTVGTRLAPQEYERELLEQYAQGHLTLGQVLARLDSRVHHLVYHSQATTLLSEAQLTQLVEQSQAWNAVHDITGLLCYSSTGHFVQVLEGSADVVHALMTNIKRDKRHSGVRILSDHTTDKRWFADWRMAFVSTEPHEYYWLMGYLEAKSCNLIRPQIPITSSALIELIKAFSIV